MTTQYKFKAFRYSQHWQAWVTGIGLMLLIIVIPFLFYISFIYTDWKYYKTPLLELLLYYAIVTIPLVFLYFYVMRKLFYKNTTVSINKDLLLIEINDTKIILKEKISQFSKVKIILKKQSEKNQIIIIELKPKNRKKLILRSGIKGSNFTRGYDQIENLEISLRKIFQDNHFKLKEKNNANGRLIINEYEHI